ncbi:hypothetical protein ACFV7Q_32970 [Streptomyces sp. NPDC059851]|uniref:hypothetical protein n=1 Tax=Streptomyces sp. NPDC059851 TaxID=3346971 RepID=UPI0036648FC3
MTTRAGDDDPWQETRYLLRSPANARRLWEAVARDREGAATVAVRAEEVHGTAPDGEERGRA